MDKTGQYGQNWTVWTKLDNMDKTGQYGPNSQICHNGKILTMDKIGQYEQYSAVISF